MSFIESTVYSPRLAECIIPLVVGILLSVSEYSLCVQLMLDSPYTYSKLWLRDGAFGIFHRGRGDEREEEHENGNSRNQCPTLVHSESADNKSNDTNDNERTDNKIARTRLVGNLLPSGEIRCHF